MVTLIGFMFILANVALLQLVVPDLVGPVRCRELGWEGASPNLSYRHQVGYTTVSPLVYGCKNKNPTSYIL